MPLLSSYLKELNKQKLFVILAIVISCVLFYLLAIFSNPVFRSSMLLKPNDFTNTANNNMELNLPFNSFLQQSSSSALVLETIKSKDFFESLYIGNKSFRDQFLSMNKLDKDTTFDDAYIIFFEKNLIIFQTKENNFVRISVDTNDAQMSFEWASLILENINRFTKNKAKDEALKSISFLEKELEQSVNVNVTNQISFLLKEEIRKLMLANVYDDFAFSVIDSPRLPQKKSSPIMSLYIAFGLVFGFFASLLTIYINILVRENSKTYA